MREESTRPRVSRILVVVPARNEELLLPSCLAALDRASARAAVPVHVEVVLDDCTDGTAEIAARWPGVHVLTVRHRCVGRARNDGSARPWPGSPTRTPRRSGSPTPTPTPPSPSTG